MTWLLACAVIVGAGVMGGMVPTIWEMFRSPSPTAFRGRWYPKSVAPAIDVMIGVDGKGGTVRLLWKNGEAHTLTAEEADQLSAALYVASMEAQGEPLQAGGAQ